MEKRETARRQTFYRPFFSLILFFDSFPFLLTGHFQHDHHLNYGGNIHSSNVQINFRDGSSQGLVLNQELGSLLISIKGINF